MEGQSRQGQPNLICRSLSSLLLLLLLSSFFSSALPISQSALPTAPSLWPGKAVYIFPCKHPSEQHGLLINNNNSALQKLPFQQLSHVGLSLPSLPSRPGCSHLLASAQLILFPSSHSKYCLFLRWFLLVLTLSYQYPKIKFPHYFQDEISRIEI